VLELAIVLMPASTLFSQKDLWSKF